MRKPQRHALLWYRFKGTRAYSWTVLFVTTPLISSTVKSGHVRIRGITIFDAAADVHLILIDASQSREDQDETLHHELMHVAAHESDDVLSDATEERAICAISPRLLLLFQHTARLRWPRRPAGFAAFERFAKQFHT